MNEKIDILQNIFGFHKKENDSQFLFFCPFCLEQHHKPKLSVNIRENKFRCWICGISGKDIEKLVKLGGSEQDVKEWRSLSGGITGDLSDLEKYFSVSEDKPKITKLELPKEFVSLTNKNLSAVGHKAKNYLTSRGLTQEDINMYKIGYCSSGTLKERVIIPSFDFNGDVNYFVARSFVGSSNKYMNPKIEKDIIFNELFVDWSKDIILVEGVFDSIKAGFQAIPILGSFLKENSLLFRKIIRNNSIVYSSLDDDAKSKEFKIIDKLLEYGLKVFKVPSVQHGDVGDLSKGDFETYFNDSFEITKDTSLLYKFNMEA